VTWWTYLSTLRFAALTWLFTLAIGFTVAYFLAFHVRTTLWQMVLFGLCTVPFLTSNIIRMISWIPFLGRNGLLNQALSKVPPHCVRVALFPLPMRTLFPLAPAPKLPAKSTTARHGPTLQLVPTAPLSSKTNP